MAKLALALLAGLTLADASVVTLALPPLLRELDTSVEGVAAVIGVYTAILAPGLLVGARLARRPWAGVAGALVFALASIGCGVAGSLAVLLAFRAVQAAGAAVVLPAAFLALDGRGAGRRMWLGATVFATAAGPALGGILTEAFDWRAIFLAGVPVALAGAAGAAALVPRGAGAGASPGAARLVPAGAGASPGAAGATAAEPLPLRRGLALGALAAALTAVLFLLVLLLVAGWSLSPLAAAATVSVLPLTALAAYSLGPRGPWRAPAGCALVGAGVLCLAFLPTASVAWTIVPQLLAGAGMGLALPALAGDDDPPALSVRHAGITLALLALGPVVSSALDHATERARLRGVALVLDSSLDPKAKLTVGPALVDGVDSQDPRAGLRRATAVQVAAAAPEDRADVAALGRRADDTLVRAVGEAFRPAFLITGALALAAALLALPAGGGARAGPARLRPGRPGVPLGAAAALVALVIALPVAYGVLFAEVAPTPPALGDPCHPGKEPESGGLSGLLQTGALALLDRAACRLGSTREELALALADPSERRRFERRYGVDPRSVTDVLRVLF